MQLSRKQFVEWGRSGGRARAARLSKAKRKHKLPQPLQPARPRGRPPGSSKVDVDGAVLLYKSGKTLAEVGEQYGVTRERVRQILKKAGYSRMDGGITIRTFLNTPLRQKRKREADERRQANVYKRWGITLEAYKALCAKYGSSSNSASPLRKFTEHRRNAAMRGIDWKLTFGEWWEIWRASKKWLRRGRGHNYSMARFGDIGAYAPGNVEIITCVQNSADQWISGKQRKPANNGAHTVTKSKEYLDRLAVVFNLRKDGATMPVIAGKVGMSRQWVQKVLAAKR